MMRSLFSGVTGLKAHQSKMDVIGNNVANVNTVGFKSSRVMFQEVFSQTLRNAGAPDTSSGRGGTNPMQVGLGLGISAIDTVMTRGTLQRTDNPLDCSIEGDGFFIVKGSNADQYKSSRAGNFEIDRDGYLTMPGGQVLYGWQQYSKDAQGIYSFKTEKDIEKLNIYDDPTNGNKKFIAGKAVTNSTLSGNLDASEPIVDPALPATTAQVTVPINVFDSLGNDYPLNIEYFKTKVEEVAGIQRDVDGKPVLDAAGATIPAQVSQTTWHWKVNCAGIPTIAPTEGDIIFDEFGLVKDMNDPANKPTIVLEPDRNTVGSAALNVTLDFTRLTTYKDTSTAKPTYVDGYRPGTLVSFNVGGDGTITGVYSNGQQKPLGMLALAVFDNPSGLKKEGENLFSPTTNSGEYRNPTAAGKNGSGTLNPGTLEMSNVDLSKEFTEMIVTQRGFQANGRIITASDEMLQDLMSIKR